MNILARRCVVMSNCRQLWQFEGMQPPAVWHHLHPEETELLRRSRWSSWSCLLPSVLTSESASTRDRWEQSRWLLVGIRQERSLIMSLDEEVRGRAAEQEHP